MHRRGRASVGGYGPKVRQATPVGPRGRPGSGGDGYTRRASGPLTGVDLVARRSPGQPRSPMTATAEPQVTIAQRPPIRPPRRSPGPGASRSSGRSPASGSSSWTARWARCSRRYGLVRGGLPRRRASATTRATCAATTTSCRLTQPGRRPRDPRRLPRGRRRHHRDEHVHGHAHRPGRLRPRGGRPRDERGRGPARPRGRGRGRGARARAGRATSAGALGPDQPDRLDLARRRATPAPATSRFDELVDGLPARRRPGLVEGGADLLLVETIFDTLNAKAAIFAIDDAVRASSAFRLPLMISGTITDASRPDALAARPSRRSGTRVRHARPFSVGLNCALGARQLREHVARPGPDRRRPGLGLPERRPAQRVRRLRRDGPETSAGARASSPSDGLVNIVGGCCGTTPAHVRGDRRGGRAASPPRPIPAVAPPTRLSGLEPVTIPPAGQRLRQRRRADERHRLAQVRPAHPRGPLRRGASRSPASRSTNGAQLIDVNMDEAMLDSARGDDPLPRPDRRRAGHRAGSRSWSTRSKWSVIEAGPEVQLQGRAVVNSISSRRARPSSSRQARLVPALRRGGRRHGLRRGGPGRHRRAQGRRSPTRAYRLLTDVVGFEPEDIILDPNIFAIATGIEEHADYAVAFIEATRRIKAELPGALVSGGVSQRLVRVPRQRPRPRGDPLGLPVPRDRRRDGHGHRQRRRAARSTTTSTRSCASCVEDVVLDRRPDATERLARDRRRATPRRAPAWSGGRRPRLARAAGRRAADPRPRRGHRRLDRRGHRGGPAGRRPARSRSSRAR